MVYFVDEQAQCLKRINNQEQAQSKSATSCGHCSAVLLRKNNCSATSILPLIVRRRQIVVLSLSGDARWSFSASLGKVALLFAFWQGIDV